MNLVDRAKFRVILADDDFITAKYLKMFLEREAIEVDCTTNGLELVSKLKQQAYDLVITDWLMPELDGLGAANVIRNQIGMTDIPIILYSTRLVGSAENEQIRNLNISHVLRKPLDAPRMLRLIKSTLSAVNV
ncbi:MAG: response regulator [Cyclobacteriaceae bacterium]